MITRLFRPTFVKAAFAFAILACATGLADGFYRHNLPEYVRSHSPPPREKRYDDMNDYSSENYDLIREVTLLGIAVGVPLLLAMFTCALLSFIFLAIAVLRRNAAFEIGWFWTTSLLLIAFLCWFIPQRVFPILTAPA